MTPPAISRNHPINAVGGVRLYGLLTLIAVAVLLPGLAALPAIDRDEARFMQATRQMVDSGDYRHIRFQNLPRDKKPPGAHWLQAAAVNFLPAEPTARWPYRIPSALGLWLAALATAAAAAATRSPGPLWAGAILLTFAVTTIEGHLAKADAPLLALAALCFAVLRIAYVSGGVPPLALMGFWVALGASMVVKGPVVVALCTLAVAALSIADRGASWLWRLRPIIGLPLALVVVTAWVGIVGSDEASRFTREAVLQDLVPKLVGGVESHGAPPGSHTVAAALTLWPWSALVPVAAIAAWRLRRERDVRFALAWIVPFWIALELVPTKLPHYVLPCLPAIAVLLAEALTTHGRMVADDAKVARTIGVIAALSLPLAWTTAVAWASMKGLLAVSVAAIFSIAVTFAIAGLLVNATLIRERGTLIVIGAALYLALVMGLVLPGAGRLDTAGQLHAAIRSVDPDAPVALVGYHEPSAVFALGTDTLLTDPAGAAAFILDRPGAIAGIATVDFGAAQQAAATRGGNLVPIVTVSGYNYAKESMVELVVVKGAP